MADNTLVSKEGLLTTSLSILADIVNNPAEDSLLASDDEDIPCGQMSTERRKNTNLQENGDQPLQRNRKTNNTERRNGDPRESKRLNVINQTPTIRENGAKSKNRAKRVHRNVIMMTLVNRKNTYLLKNSALLQKSLKTPLRTRYKSPKNPSPN